MGIEVYLILIILAIPIFFLWRRIFKNLNLSRGKKQAAIWVFTIISTPFVYASLIFVWIFIISFYPEKDFDKRAWSVNKESRYEMSADIIKSKILIGKTKKEVAALLGDPGDMASDEWHYDLGFVPGILNIDPDVLIIGFKNGKVVSVSQYTS